MGNAGFPKTVFITINPSPYRVTLYDLLGSVLREKFSVIYCPENINNLPWEATCLKHVNYSLKDIHINLIFKTIVFHVGIWQKLQMIKPDVIVTGGFRIPMLTAIVFAKLYRKKHIIITDAWEHTEKEYSFLHILIRKTVYKYGNAFFPVGEKGKKNFLRYGVDKKKIFIVPYSIDENNYYPKDKTKLYDIMFCGQFIERKMPLFLCEVAKGLNALNGDIRVLILGKGPLENEIRNFLKREGIKYTMPGFVQQNDIIHYYQKSKVFLFPTKSDGWGVVANEACASGLPVITCDYAGAANDLIINKYNGFVLPLDVDIWTNQIQLLLNDPVLYSYLSQNALDSVKNYSSLVASNNVFKALENVMVPDINVE